MVTRIYVEKKPAFAVKAKALCEELSDYLHIPGLKEVRKAVRYDVEGLSEKVLENACRTVFAEPPVDDLYMEEWNPGEGYTRFAVEYLPGQFDQRADSAVQCVELLAEDGEGLGSIRVKTADCYALAGDLSEEEIEKIKSYLINPVDSGEASEEKPKTLEEIYPEAEDVPVLEGFTELNEDALKQLYSSFSLAMTLADFKHIQNYFKNEEHRDPTETEIRVLDTYWSDHCRHTTFGTEITNVSIDDGYYKIPIETAYQSYLDTRKELYGEKEQEKSFCLMDLALIAMKKLKAEGKLADQEDSEENNACSIVVPITVTDENGPHEEEWLLFFKNETHNHPTEIEPFGGAATCLGGAIRDPLSGRGYVYQAMRVTGAADPTRPIGETLKGKLPQIKLTRGAAEGYSSYGNQIGLATGLVEEIYHPGYVAKRMEIGAVLGAAKRSQVLRERPAAGDLIILLGGRTGRDGIGGATGSSKAHTDSSLTTCGAEVQKGNAPTERKLQRLFRDQEASLLIKRCNDFGAGGVSVAIGELADGLTVELDKVPKKYMGLGGTELAISESQERMAVVVAKEDAERFLALSARENLEATIVAEVTEEPRLVLNFRGKKIVDLSRAFLDTNGARQETAVHITMPGEEENPFGVSDIPGLRDAVDAGDSEKAFLSVVSDLNHCSGKGLVERFDSTIGAASVFMPFGGKFQRTKNQTMAAKFPVLHGNTDAVSLMSYGFDPKLSSWSPYHGAVWAVTQSIARIVATGGDYKKIRFTFQEYFRRMTTDPATWGEPFSALLGAYDAQLGFGLPSIGGKDSMSGSFNELHVPPTLVSFAVDTAKHQELISPEFKTPGNSLVFFPLERDSFDVPVYEYAEEVFDTVHNLIIEKKIASAQALDAAGIGAGIVNMALGNRLGAEISEKISLRELFENNIGGILAECLPEGLPEDCPVEYTVLGTVIDAPEIRLHSEERETQVIDLMKLQDAWEAPLEKVFPTKTKEKLAVWEEKPYTDGVSVHCKMKASPVGVFIPVMPGTNCEYDSARAFEQVGASVETRVFRNLAPKDISESLAEFEQAIDKARILFFPGGFSAGDEPDGSAKFFANVFRNPRLAEAVDRLLNERDGLILGICNGFQTLIKLGLLPYGKICPQTVDSPTLTYNTLGRHISRMVYTKVTSNLSPWLSGVKVGDVIATPASHGEGRFVATDAVLTELFAKGQVATRYADPEGNIVMSEEWNVNGSYAAIEGITSPDGRIFGKMGHVERRGEGVQKNIFGEQDLKLFRSGVEYFQ